MNANIPMACSLNAAELQVRGTEIADLSQHVQAVQELADGYAFAFPPTEEMAHALLDFAVTERACCPFFTFSLQFPAPHDQVWLDIRGQEGVKTIIAGSGFSEAIARFRES